MDSLYINGRKCYKLDIKHKNKQDLAFEGSIWIADTLFALTQLDLSIAEDANLNYVKTIRIQQTLDTVANSTIWFPTKTRIVIDFGNLMKGLMSGLLKSYTSNQNIVVGKSNPTEFYKKTNTTAEDAKIKTANYWLRSRHEPYSLAEYQSEKLIDSINRMPIVKNTVNVFYLLGLGFWDFGKFEVGPYFNAYSFNQYEGNRIKVGIRTTKKFSEQWSIRGYLAYGFLDKGFKWNLQTDKIISRFPWKKAGVQWRSDIDQLGVNYNFGASTGNLSVFDIAAQSGNNLKLVRKQEYRAWYEAEIYNGITTRIAFQNINNKPLFNLDFGDGNKTVFNTTEINLNARIALDASYVQNGIERLSIADPKLPVLNINYLVGIKGLLGGEFGYHKVTLGISQVKRFGLYGRLNYNLTAVKTFSTIPYNLLDVHRGNETLFLSQSANVFNTMNFFEFVSDQYIAAKVEHHFNGLLLNRVPLIKKLKWRELLVANAIYGGLSAKNLAFNEGNTFSTLNRRPYVEAGVGIENIFTIFRIDLLYRLTYTDAEYLAERPDVFISPYYVKFGLSFGL